MAWSVFKLHPLEVSLPIFDLDEGKQFGVYWPHTFSFLSHLSPRFLLGTWRIKMARCLSNAISSAFWILCFASACILAGEASRPLKCLTVVNCIGSRDVRNYTAHCQPKEMSLPGASPCEACFSISYLNQDSGLVSYTKSCGRRSECPQGGLSCTVADFNDTEMLGLPESERLAVCSSCCLEENCNTGPPRVYGSDISKNYCRWSCGRIWSSMKSAIEALPAEAAVTSPNLSGILFHIARNCSLDAGANVSTSCFPAYKLRIAVYRQSPATPPSSFSRASPTEFQQMVHTVHSAVVNQLNLSAGNLVSLGIPSPVPSVDEVRDKSGRTVTLLMIVADRTQLAARQQGQPLSAELQAFPKTLATRLRSAEAELQSIPVVYGKSQLTFGVISFSLCDDVRCKRTALGYKDVLNPSFAYLRSSSSRATGSYASNAMLGLLGLLPIIFAL